MPNVISEENRVKLEIVEGAIYRKETNKKVKSIGDWTKCFLKYIAVMMQRKIHKTPPMISYMTTFLQAADTCSPGFGWRKYDKQFRLKLASSPSMAWDVIDNHLWLMCIINQQPEIAEVKEVKDTKIEKPKQPFSNNRGATHAPGEEEGVEVRWQTTLGANTHHLPISIGKYQTHVTTST
jgi:hypothetical protein